MHLTVLGAKVKYTNFNESIIIKLFSNLNKNHLGKSVILHLEKRNQSLFSNYGQIRIFNGASENSFQL